MSDQRYTVFVDLEPEVIGVLVRDGHLEHSSRPPITYILTEKGAEYLLKWLKLPGEETDRDPDKALFKVGDNALYSDLSPWTVVRIRQVISTAPWHQWVYWIEFADGHKQWTTAPPLRKTRRRKLGDVTDDG